MAEDFHTIRKMIEGDEPENSEVIAYNITLNCDVSIMSLEAEGGKTAYSVLLHFPPTKHEDDEEANEASAELHYSFDDDQNPMESLDEVLRLLGIAPERKIWVSEQ